MGAIAVVVMAVLWVGLINVSTVEGYLYVGSFTTNTITWYQQSGGSLIRKGSTQAGQGTTWMQTRNGFLYTTFEGAGQVASYRINNQTDGSLTFLSQQSTQGNSPTHLTLDTSGEFLLAANYGTGNVIVFPVNKGVLGGSVSVNQQSGTGPNKNRQEGPHAHQIVVDRQSNAYALSADLGADKVFQYKFNVLTGKLTSNGVFSTLPGDGPRHLAFHPNNQFAYLACELSSVLIVLSYSATTGTFSPTPIQRLALPDPNFKGTNAPAEVIVHPSGNFLYVSNRGNDSVSVFRLSSKTGFASHYSVVPTGGSSPRGLFLDTQAGYLYAANQNSGTITGLKIQSGGALDPPVIMASGLTQPVSFTKF